jgi:hypothetical protein
MIMMDSVTCQGLGLNIIGVSYCVSCQYKLNYFVVVIVIVSARCLGMREFNIIQMSLICIS